MRKLLLILCYLPYFLFSQNAEEVKDLYNLDIARELGLCYNELTPTETGSDYFHPLCSDSTVRVFFLEPNYYAIYIDYLRWCGSCGCQMELFRKEADKYTSVDYWHCCGVDLKQPVTDYILVSDDENGPGCWSAYTFKLKVRSDRFYIEEITEYKHKIHDNHAGFCVRGDSLWLIDRYESENRLPK